MNTIASIAAKINQFAAQFQITKEAVEVTSYEQMGPNVRVFYLLNRTIGKTPEQIKKMTQPIRELNILMPDPFAEGGETPVDPVDPVDPTDKKVTAFTVDLPASIKVGDSTAVAPVFTPADATDKTYTVTANPEGFVSVLNSGQLITGLKPGSVTLTFHANGGEVADVVKVLNVEAILPTGISATFAKQEVEVGETFAPTVAVTPENATDKTYKLNTSDASVIAVDGTSYTAKKAGTATLSVTSIAASGVKSTTTPVTVKAVDTDPEG